MGTFLKQGYVLVSHEFQTVYCNWVQVKSPLILKVVVANCICCNNFDLKNKKVNYRK